MATFRKSIMNMCSKHDLRQPLIIQFWCSTYRLSGPHLFSKHEETRVLTFDLQIICAENGLEV